MFIVPLPSKLFTCINKKTIHGDGMTCSTSLSLPYAFQQHMQIMQILFASALHYITGENKLLAHAPADRNKYA